MKKNVCVHRHDKLFQIHHLQLDVFDHISLHPYQLLVTIHSLPKSSNNCISSSLIKIINFNFSLKFDLEWMYVHYFTIHNVQSSILLLIWFVLLMSQIILNWNQWCSWWSLRGNSRATLISTSVVMLIFIVTSISVSLFFFTTPLSGLNAIEYFELWGGWISNLIESFSLSRDFFN